MNQSSPNPSPASRGSDVASADSRPCNRQAYRRNGVWRKLFGATLLVSLVAGAAYMGAGHANPGMRGGHSMLSSVFEPATAGKKIDAVVAFGLADIDGTEAQKAKIGEIAKGALADLIPLRAAHQAARDKAVELLSSPIIDRAALEQVRASELMLAETASKRLTSAIADAAEALEPAQRARLAVKMKQRMARHG